MRTDKPTGLRRRPRAGGSTRHGARSSPWPPTCSPGYATSPSTGTSPRPNPRPCVLPDPAHRRPDHSRTATALDQHPAHLALGQPTHHRVRPRDGPAHTRPTPPPPSHRPQEGDPDRPVEPAPGATAGTAGTTAYPPAERRSTQRQSGARGTTSHRRKTEVITYPWPTPAMVTCDGWTTTACEPDETLEEVGARRLREPAFVYIPTLARDAQHPEAWVSVPGSGQVHQRGAPRTVL